MGALLRLSSIRRLKLKLYTVGRFIARQMFRTIKKMPVLESLDADVQNAMNYEKWPYGTLETLPPSLVRFAGSASDMRHLIRRKDRCDEIVIDISDKLVLYPLNARKIVINGRGIEQFDNYYRPPLHKSTEILEFPCGLEFPSVWSALESRELGDGVLQVTAQRKTPIVVLRIKAQLDLIARIADMTAQFAEIKQNADCLLSELEQRKIRLRGLRLEVTIWLYEAAKDDANFMQKFEQYLAANYGPKIDGKKAKETQWIRVSTIRDTEVTTELMWDFYEASGNEHMYEKEFDELEFDCGLSREEFDERKKELGYADSSDERD
ncbi:hypothetical protein M3Y99_01044100 [Aphelenchoides fujianensis]|nr:hypothetical protein M3Y99_01044100 [Aphelenchoides fujianensis]